MSHQVTRREFLRRAAAAGTSIPLATAAATLSAPRPVLAASEKLNIGVIGVAGRGAANLDGVAHHQIVCLCDIDADRLGKAAERFPSAKTYADFRRVIDHANLDCVVVSTPDHMHAFCAVAALQAGLDVYCEKPLSHSVWEVRQIRNWAARQKAVTQLGTQIHAGENYRRAVEIVESGLLGPVERVHIWFGGRNLSFKEITTGPPPANVDYNLWLGPAPEQPFSPQHFHYNWRYWWDFGNGVFGDFVCHYMDLPFWALKLREPIWVQAEGSKGHDGVNDCPDNLRVDWQYPARGAMPPVHLTWYQGSYRPPEMAEYGAGKANAVLFEGTKGLLLADYGSRKLFMNPGESEAVPEPSIPDSVGHHEEFLRAVKERGTTSCNFDYSGALSEAGLLGNVSYRAGGKKLVWDAEKLQAKGCPEADLFIQRDYRTGWSL